MSPEQARDVFFEHCQPGDRGTLESYGTRAAMAAITSVTGFIESEARRYAGHYTPHSDGWNTFIMFADMVSDLTADRISNAAKVEADD